MGIVDVRSGRWPRHQQVGAALLQEGTAASTSGSWGHSTSELELCKEAAASITWFRRETLTSSSRVSLEPASSSPEKLLQLQLQSFGAGVRRQRA
jgi:hypothetical protein